MDKPIILSEQGVAEALADLPGWTYADGKITKEFQFADFVDSLSFINSLVAFFEVNDHHPDAHIFYNKVQFDLTRYDAGGKVTDRDIVVAKKIEEAFSNRKK